MIVVEGLPTRRVQIRPPLPPVQRSRARAGDAASRPRARPDPVRNRHANAASIASHRAARVNRAYGTIMELASAERLHHSAAGIRPRASSSAAADNRRPARATARSCDFGRAVSVERARWARRFASSSSAVICWITWPRPLEMNRPLAGRRRWRDLRRRASSLSPPAETVTPPSSA